MNKLINLYISLLENPNAENSYENIKKYYLEIKDKEKHELFKHIIEKKFKNENSNILQK